MAVDHPILYGLDGAFAAVLDKASELELEEILDEGESLSFSIPATDPKAALIDEDAEIVFESRRFRITEVDRARQITSQTIGIEATGAYIELLDRTHRGVLEILSRTPAIGLAEILVDSGWTAGDVEDAGVNVATLAETNRTVLWLVRTWARIVGLEIEWDTLNRVVHLRAAVGSDRAARFEYRRNLRSIRKKSTPPQATVIWPTGRNGLDIAGVNLGLRFLEDFSWYTATQGLTLTQARARFTKDYVFNDDRFLNAEALMVYAERRLELLAQPIVSYEAEVIDLQSLTGVQEPFTLGDPVLVRDAEMGIDVTARIVRYVRHPREPQKNAVELSFLIPGLETPIEDQGISTELALLGEQLLYGENELEMAFTTAYATGITIAVSAYSFTNAKAGINLVGTASAAGRLTIEVVYGTDLVRTFEWPVVVGLNTVAIPFIIGGIPGGVENLFFRLKTSTGTFVVDAFRGQFWIEAKNVAGGASSGDPSQYVFDTAPREPYPSITDVVSYAIGSPDIAASAFEDVPAPSVTDIGVYVLSLSPSVNADDGSTGDSPVFTAGANYTEVGDDAGVKYGAWYRFPLSLDLSPFTIREAHLYGMGDQNDVGALTKIRAELGATPAAPADRADYLARARTTAAVDWDATITSGSFSESPDLKTIIDELVSTYGAALTAILIFHEDDGSPTNSKMLFRSKENGTGPPMALRIHLTS